MITSYIKLVTRANARDRNHQLQLVGQYNSCKQHDENCVGCILEICQLSIQYSKLNPPTDTGVWRRWFKTH